MPNQFGIDDFDLNDAFSEQNEHMCSSDLREFIAENHLDLSLNGGNGSHFDARAAFGSHSDSDHIYNTPRAWFMERYFNPKTKKWDGPDADYRPESDDIPWSMVPEKKITVEDVKYALSSHFQGTPYDPYAKSGDGLQKGKYRAIGINRNDFLALIQMRPVPRQTARRSSGWLSRQTRSTPWFRSTRLWTRHRSTLRTPRRKSLQRTSTGPRE